MRHRNLHRPLLLLAFSLWSLTPVRTASAGLVVTYDVSIDTTSISGTSGFIDFQFNPGMGSAVFATAGVSNFSTDGTVDSLASPPTGDATGPSSGPLTTLSFDNGTPLNELTYAFSYGNTVTFDVTLMQSMAGGSGSTFSFNLLDLNGDPYLNGGTATVTITINPDLSTTAIANLPDDGVTGTVTPVVSSVPEPATLLLEGIGIVAFVGWSRFRRRAAISFSRGRRER